MAEGGDCLQSRSGKGRGLPFGRPVERELLRRPFTCSQKVEQNNANEILGNVENRSKECIVNHHETLPSPEASYHHQPNELRTDMKAAEQEPLNNMQLRPTAPEFVPRSLYLTLTTPHETKETESNLASCGSHAHQLSEVESENHIHNDIINQLKDFIDLLAVDPGKYDNIETSLIEMLTSYMTSEQTLKAVIDQIFQRSIADPNLTYNGARLCNFLSQNLLSNNGENIFRDYLLHRCQNEIREAQKLRYQMKDFKWLRGLVHFTGELFIHLELVDHEGLIHRYDILGTFLPDLLEILLSQPVEENVKCVTRVLKFTGAALEDDHNKQATFKMDTLMKKIEDLWSDNCSRSSVEQFKSILDLRASNWGRSTSWERALSPPMIRDEPFMGDFSCGEPVLYGPDGQPLTREESQFLESNHNLYEGDDDFNDYQEFG